MGLPFIQRIYELFKNGFGLVITRTQWQQAVREGRGFNIITGYVTVTSTAETDFLLIRNPTASGIRTALEEFNLTVAGNSTQTSRFRFYRAPIFSDPGTLLSVQKILGTSSRTSKILAYQSPTITNRGNLVALFSVGFTSLPRQQDLARFIPEGNDLLVTVAPSANNLEHNITFIFAEEDL